MRIAAGDLASIVIVPPAGGAEELARLDALKTNRSALLAEAGYPNGFDIDFYAYRERQQTEAMIGYLRAVGIRANLRYMQYAAMRDLLREGKAGFAHQTWGSFSVNDVSASPPVFFKFLLDDVNRDQRVRDLLDAGDFSVKPEVRRVAYKNALALIAEKGLR